MKYLFYKNRRAELDEWVLISPYGTVLMNWFGTGRAAWFQALRIIRATENAKARLFW